MGSTPILDRPTLGAYYQTHEQAAANGKPRALPDHYPLVTRQGTVPVAALSDRGLYSQRRYRAIHYAMDAGPGAMPEAYEPVQPQFDGGDGNVHIRHASVPTDGEHAAPVPLPLAEGPAVVQPEGQAKILNVATALAMR